STRSCRSPATADGPAPGPPRPRGGLANSHQFPLDGRGGSDVQLSTQGGVCMSYATARVVGIVVTLACASRVGAWPVRIDGTEHERDEAHSVAVDAAGDVYTTGFLENVNAARALTVVKHAGANGAELWRQALPGTSVSY